jgi:thiamine-monophosphate kinase
LLTVDSCVENVHFRREWFSPAMLGRRAFRVAASDLSAMGGSPRFVLLSIAAPGTLDSAYARRVVKGLIADAAAVGAFLVGGNVAGANDLAFHVTVVGSAKAKPILRSGAKPGDAVWVTGTLGDAAAGIAMLEAGASRGRLVSAYRTPPLRVDTACRLASTGAVTSMIDVSDGFAQDLGHVCRASSVRASIDLARLPVSAALRRACRSGLLAGDANSYALTGGEAYELIFTSAGDAKTEGRIRRACEESGCMVTRVGAMRRPGKEPPGAYARDGRALRGGFSHYGKKR